MSSHPVVLYDGVCSLCDASVQFIIDRDPAGLFQFASLQSAIGAGLAADAGVDASSLDTLVVLTETGAHLRSDAVLEIARRLRRPWPIVRAARVVPKPLRDAAYRLLARHRFRLFGRLDACRIPTPELRARFLDLTF